MAVASTLAKEFGLFPLSVKQHHKMIRLAVLTEDHAVELLEGVLAKKKPHNPPHDAVPSGLHYFFDKKLNCDWVVCNQSAITLTKSEPESDLTIVTNPNSSSIHISVLNQRSDDILDHLINRIGANDLAERRI